jgi:hypothetical protein
MKQSTFDRKSTTTDLAPLPIERPIGVLISVAPLETRWDEDEEIKVEEKKEKEKKEEEKKENNDIDVLFPPFVREDESPTGKGVDDLPLIIPS